MPNSESEFEIEFYKKLIKDDSIVFDIGARDSSIPYINKNANYYLFEPIIFNYDRLIERFKDEKNITIKNLCLSDVKEDVTIYLESESIHRRLNFNYIWKSVNPFRVRNGETENIKCITLKNFIEDNDIKKIDLLKMDVEGYEYKVIKGLYEHLNIVNCIIFEYSIGTYESSGSNLLDVLNILKDFTFYVITNDNNIFRKIEGSNLDIYNQLKNENNCNIVALKNG